MSSILYLLVLPVLSFASDDEEFRTLELGIKKQERRAARIMRTPNIVPPRYKRQKIDQDWGSVWPAARTFHPATVPLPVRQGYPAEGQPIPDKWGNAELMKIPNFLHLTPPVIKRQCEVLKSMYQL
ncbi:28S ribosomal protein S35-like 2 [Homarus americanus]|uniref:28S ribosomal protein S35-like 2 n=1 Tax=Homarus americanus TaxID=6706 RepID=A0A8J5K854_HOMAM|nr:28S ribosomal protein S35-like 2 [Homarus americanus]